MDQELQALLQEFSGHAPEMHRGALDLTGPAIRYGPLAASHRVDERIHSRRRPA